MTIVIVNADVDQTMTRKRKDVTTMLNSNLMTRLLEFRKVLQSISSRRQASKCSLKTMMAKLVGKPTTPKFTYTMNGI